MRFLLLLLLFHHGLYSQINNISTFDNAKLARVDTFINEWVSSGKVPNASIFISHKGKPIMHKGYGYKNMEDKVLLKKDDIFRIASQTKLLTSLCVLMLMEEGHFHLEEPISKFIPAFTSPKILVNVDKKDKTIYETKPSKNAITIRHLLTHTAGIPYEHELEDLQEFKVPFFCSTASDNLEDVVNKIALRPLLFEPGSAFQYGLNTDILGRLVEVVSGKSLNEFMIERLFLPLRMKDTYFYLPKEKHNRLVELYSLEKNGDKLTVNKNDLYRNFSKEGAQTYYSGGAGLVSTVADYAKVCQLILDNGRANGKQILSRSTIEMLSRNQITPLTFWGRNDGFGLGVQIASDASHYMDNAAPGTMMWGGMYCSEYTIDPKNELIAIIFTNIHPYAYYSDFLRRFRILAYSALK
jgi:CubicO group peptidase (beta-lactamase class C family)